MFQMPTAEIRIVFEWYWMGAFPVIFNVQVFSNIPDFPPPQPPPEAIHVDLYDVYNNHVANLNAMDPSSSSSISSSTVASEINIGTGTTSTSYE